MKNMKNKQHRNRGDRTLVAQIRMSRNGAGCVTAEETGETFWIEHRDLGTALNGDTVKVRIFKNRGAVSARVASIEKRSSRDIAGTLVATGRFNSVRPLNPVYGRDFSVSSPNGAKLGDRVVMRFKRWDNVHIAPEGEIIQVIGPSSRADLDTETLIKEYDLPEGFPQEVLDEAEGVASFLENRRGRLDLRNKFIFTCDPDSAKDFDDALSLETDSSGNRVLGVHIADVSHFVRENSALDKEALARGTSTYLIDTVVPMLPEQLSNGVCSLVPGEDRFAFSAFITFDKKGRVLSSKFAKTLIRSRLRLTYAQLRRILAKPSTARLPHQVKDFASRKVVENICAINELARLLRSRRFTSGAIEMSIPEVKIVMGRNGEMKGVEVEPYDEPHQLVEECMIAANEAAAHELWGGGVRCLARLHEDPDADKLQELRENLLKMGIKAGNLAAPGALSKLMKNMKGNPLEPVVAVMVLKSMKRALYSAKAMGHFGLAKKYYSHFTSPIRRYPDLVLHRQLSAKISGAKSRGRIQQTLLDSIAAKTTEREQIADDAERAITEIKKFRFMEKQLSSGRYHSYDAVIAKCATYGVFIDIAEIACSGMIHVSELSDSYVRFSPWNGILTDGKRTWKPGDRITVRISNVDFDLRRMDFIPVSKQSR